MPNPKLVTNPFLDPSLKGKRKGPFEELSEDEEDHEEKMKKKKMLIAAQIANMKPVKTECKLLI